MPELSLPEAAVTGPRNYYPALDGLRAVAALMVFYEHYVSAPLNRFGWGWTGVDIFFVLSGFLITGILYDGRDKEHRVRDFYLRRSLRIFPLYYFCWAAFLVVSPLANFQWNWRWSVWPAYIGNYAPLFFRHASGDPAQFFWIGLGPRAQAWFGRPMHIPIGHFWSLCVEEQFYLVWPAMVYLVRKRETLLKICLAAIVLAPVLRFAALLLAHGAHSLAVVEIYSSLPTRLDALLVGGGVALLLRGPHHAQLHRWGRRTLATAAVLLIVAMLLSGKARHLFNYGSTASWYLAVSFTVIDLVAAAVLLECIHPGSWAGKLLSWRPLRALGMISYGIYVYHYLPYDFYNYFAARYFSRHALFVTALAAISVTLALATASYWLLERPMLRLKGRFTQQAHWAPPA